MQLRSGFSARGFVAFPDGVHPRVVEDRRGQTGKTAWQHSPSHSSVPVTASSGHTMPTSATLVTILTTHPRARSGRREISRRTTPTAEQDIVARCHARCRPAWLSCGPESFPKARGRRRGAQNKAVVTHAGVSSGDVRGPPIQGSEQSSLSDSVAVLDGSAWKVGAHGICGVSDSLGVGRNLQHGSACALVVIPLRSNPMH